jgi:hypothetical protein
MSGQTRHLVGAIRNSKGNANSSASEDPSFPSYQKHRVHVDRLGLNMALVIKPNCRKTVTAGPATWTSSMTNSVTLLQTAFPHVSAQLSKARANLK